VWPLGVAHGVGHFTVVVSGRALPRRVERTMLRGQEAPKETAHMAKDEQTKSEGTDEPGDEKDVEGHNIFATQDYFQQRNIDRRTELDRDIRERQRAREAEEKNKKRR